MNKHILTFTLLLLTNTTFSQAVELDIHGQRLSHFLKKELGLGGRLLENKSTYILQKGIAQPVMFEHKETNLPDLITYYFFYQKDSMIQYIRYEWDAGYTGEPVHKSPEEIDAFIVKYKDLYNQIFKAYGKSISEGNLTGLTKIETGNFRKKDIWHTGDNTEIELSIVLSGRYEKRGSITINPAYRIRLYVRNPDKAKASTEN
jgi:hypothetical protein